MSIHSTTAGLVQSLATRKALIVASMCFAVFATAFFASSAPFAIPHVEAACGAAPLDVRFHSTAAEVQGFLDACGPDGRAAYRNMQIADLVYPTVFGLFMISALAVTLKHLVPSRPDVLGLAAIGLAGSGFDYIENAFAWRVLATYPEIGTAGSLLGFASSAKTASHWAAGITLLGALVLLAGRVARRHVAAARSGRPAPTLS